MRQNELNKLFLTNHLTSAGQSSLISAESEKTKNSTVNHVDLLNIFSGKRFESTW